MKKIVALVMMALLVPTAAYAKNPCKDDKVKFCKDAKAAGTKVNDCLRQHINEVSSACKDQLNKPKENKPKDAEKKNKGKDNNGDKSNSENAPKKPDTAPESTTPPAAGSSGTTPPATGGETKQ